MANLQIIDYQKTVYDTGIPLDTIEYVDVIVLSGDEVITVHFKDGSTEEEFDAAVFANNFRVFDFYDRSYTVKQHLVEWNSRKTSYDSWSWDDNKYDSCDDTKVGA